MPVRYKLLVYRYAVLQFGCYDVPCVCLFFALAVAKSDLVSIITTDPEQVLPGPFYTVLFGGLACKNT